MNHHPNTKLLVLVERHLALESRLAASLDELNQTTADVLSKAGLKGPTQEDMQALEPMTETLQRSADEVRNARQVLLSRINVESGSAFTTIKEYVVSLPPSDRVRIDDIRRGILNRSSEAQANLIHNQAALFYTYDFHRKYLSGVLQSDPDEQNYRPDGQQQDIHPGNIFGKTC